MIDIPYGMRYNEAVIIVIITTLEVIYEILKATRSSTQRSIME